MYGPYPFLISSPVSLLHYLFFSFHPPLAFTVSLPCMHQSPPDHVAKRSPPPSSKTLTMAATNLRPQAAARGLPRRWNPCTTVLQRGSPSRCFNPHEHCSMLLFCDGGDVCCCELRPPELEPLPVGDAAMDGGSFKWCLAELRPFFWQSSNRYPAELRPWMLGAATS